MSGSIRRGYLLPPSLPVVILLGTPSIRPTAPNAAHSGQVQLTVGVYRTAESKRSRVRKKSCENHQSIGMRTLSLSRVLE